MRRKMRLLGNNDPRTPKREESDLFWYDDAHQEIWNTRVKVHELIRARAEKLARSKQADWRSRYTVTLQDLDQARREIFQELADKSSRTIISTIEGR